MGSTCLLFAISLIYMECAICDINVTINTGIDMWPPKNEQGIFRDIDNVNLHKEYLSLINFNIH